MGSKTE